jgi:alanine dehydrogenase
MIVGCVKEIKIGESRVGLTPDGAAALVQSGHRVLIEAGAGLGSSLSDDAYRQAGAEVIPDAAEVYASSDLMIKVKEPQPSEYPCFRPGQMLFTYLHLAAEPDLTRALLEREVTAIAYETVQLPDLSLPLLTPMSEIAGRMAVQAGAWYLQMPNGGQGKLLSGVPGVPASEVVIFGTGVVGRNAAKMALGLGGTVRVFGRRLEQLRYLDDLFGGRLITDYSTGPAIERALGDADLVISGVLIPGARAPKLITRQMLSLMKKGTVLVDVAIDQGGSFETSRPTTHEDPIYEVDGILHYCVANMPGAVPHTSTLALTNATLPYAEHLANRGFVQAIQEDPALAHGVNTYDGNCTNAAVADALGLEWVPIESLIEMREPPQPAGK